jgi:hypothetical protein
MRNPLGAVRLHAVPAPDVWHAATSLALYVVPPRSTVTVAVDAAGLVPGDLAGLVLFGKPYAWLGLERVAGSLVLARFDERAGRAAPVPLRGQRVWLRAECDFVARAATFRYSTDGRRYADSGTSHVGEESAASRAIQCSLFTCTAGQEPSGGYADFHSFFVTIDRATGPSTSPGAAGAPVTPGPSRSSPAAPARDRRRTRARGGRSRDS